MSAVTKNARIAVRATSRQKQIIERAAAALDRNVSDFAIQVLTHRAEEVLADSPVFPVSDEAWNEFQSCLDEPARPVPELVALLKQPSAFED